MKQKKRPIPSTKSLPVRTVVNGFIFGDETLRMKGPKFQSRDQIKALGEESAKLKEMVKKLKNHVKELRRYADHLSSCNMVQLSEASRGFGPKDCDCGYEKLAKKRF